MTSRSKYLDIEIETSEEIAVSIAAEIVAVRKGKFGSFEGKERK